MSDELLDACEVGVISWRITIVTADRSGGRVDYEIRKLDSEEYCHVAVSGVLRRPDDSLLLRNVAADVVSQKGIHRLLFDMSEAEVVGTTVGAYVAGSQQQGGVDFFSNVKAALVYKELTPEHKFLETVLVNRGSNLRIFSDASEAVGWLLNDLE